jgi:hypothetical protein
VSIFSEYYSAVAALDSALASRLPALEWLVSVQEKDRGTGRTRLLALAFIGAAMRRPEVGVKVFDHHDPSASRSSGQFIREAIRLASPTSVLKDDMTLFCQERAYPDDRLHHDYFLLTSAIMVDFLALCRAAVRHGVDVQWMKDQIDDTIVRRVMTE